MNVSYDNVYVNDAVLGAYEEKPEFQVKSKDRIGKVSARSGVSVTATGSEEI